MESETKTIEVPLVNIKRLRQQRNTLVRVAALIEARDGRGYASEKKEVRDLDGVISLLDTMLDIAEGYFPCGSDRGLP